MAKPY